ncbi:DUF5313 family protein [Nocardia sp. NPDC127526]|uniref:DUF5313 family protein n=1 Tax=Nocardia sp. NPDC127526 TaxID=3345393 RepID=UPI00362DD41D
MTSKPQRRPNPIQWLGYALGRRLPDSMTDWVRYDLTCKHSYMRHLIRGMVPFSPLFAAFLCFPGELWLRGAMTLLAMILAWFYCSAHMHLNRAHRLRQHGLPEDLKNPEAQKLRDFEVARYVAAHPR